MSLVDRLNTRIALEDAEIQRIISEGQTRVAEAKARKATLVAARDYVFAHPEVETLLTKLAEAGVDVVE